MSGLSATIGGTALTGAIGGGSGQAALPLPVLCAWVVDYPFAGGDPANPESGGERVDAAPSPVALTVTGHTFACNEGAGPAEIVVGHGPVGDEVQLGTLTVGADGSGSYAALSTVIPAGRSPWLQGPHDAVAGLKRFAFALQVRVAA